MVFKVKVNEVKEKQEPVVDDEFAKDVSEFDTLADLKKDLGEKLKARREEQADRSFREALMEQVIANMQVEIPDAMVDYQAEKLLNSYAQRITSQGIPFENYLSMMGMSMDDMKAQSAEAALHQVQHDLALGAIVKAEQIEITDGELEAELGRLAEQYQMELDDVKKAVNADDVKADLAEKKAADLIYDSAKLGKAPAKKTAKKTVKKAEEAEGEEKPKKATRKKKADDEEKAAE